MIMIVSDEDIEKGVKNILNSFLHQSGISSDEYDIVQLECTTTPEAQKLSVELLKRQLEGKEYNVILGLGEGVFSALTGRKGVAKRRGSLYWCKEFKCKFVGTFTPRQVMRNWEWCPLMLFDIGKVRRHDCKEYREFNPNIIIADKVEEVKRAIDHVIENNALIAFDIETNPEVNAITAFGFSYDENSAFCIPFDNRFTIQEQTANVLEIKRMLECKEVKKIAQNAQFDVLWLWEMLGIKTENLVLDTMVAHDCCYTEIPKGLDTLTSIYTDIPYYKDWIAFDLYKYNAYDAVTTFQVAKALLQEMDEMNTKDFYYKIPHPLLTPLMKMQERGVRINLELRDKARIELTEEFQKKELELAKLAGHYINVRSSKQMIEFLYGDLKLPKQFNRATGKLTADEDALLKLSKKFSSPAFDLAIEIRKLGKIIGTYLEAPLGKDERMHTGYVIGGTVTGRLASKRSLFYSGTNLQNVPKGVCREMFIPDDGYIFMNMDLSQAEARIVALAAEENAMISIFKGGGDVHKKNASWIFNIPESGVSDEQRQLAKKMVHALNYGMGYKSFAGHCNIGFGESKELIEKYFCAFPMITEWHKKLQSQLNKTRTLTNYFGRKRIFFGRWGEDLFKEAYAYIPQSTIGDLLNLILIRLYDEIIKEGVDAEILLQVHDSILLQCKEKDVSKIKTLMLLANDFDVDGIVIPMDFKIGGNWNEVS